MLKRIVSAIIAALLLFTAVPALAEDSTPPETGETAGAETDEPSNEEIIYTFLTDHMGLNSAAACGVLANIEKESGFRPDALGDGGTSYGICQWHDTVEGSGRWTSLKNFCEERELDYTELMSQLHYLEYELENRYPKVWNALYSAENTPDGAYEAAYYWCFNFEIPSNREEKSVERGNLARDKYWPVYNEAEPEIGAHEIWITDADPTLNVRTGPDTTYPKSASLEKGTEIRITEVSHSGTFLWGKTDAGWCVLDYCKYVSGALYTVNYVTECAVAIEPQPKKINEEIALTPPEALAKHGYTFVGWSTERGGEVAFPAEGGTYADNASLTLYALWERDTSVDLIAGDANSDGDFNISDAVSVLRLIAKYDVPVDTAAADVNGDGNVNVSDAVSMIRKLADWDIEFADPNPQPLPPEGGDDTTAPDETTDSDDTTDPADTEAPPAPADA